MIKKQTLLDIADVIDAYRIVPRIFISVYIYLMYTSVLWFMHLPNPSGAQATLISVMSAVGSGWFGLYVSTGKKQQGTPGG